MEQILPEIYKQFEGTELWNVVSQCLDDLVENQDIDFQRISSACRK